MNATPPAVPIARCPITVRPATTADLGFIDQLQKMHSTQVGWMPTKQLEGKVAAGQVLLATDHSQLATPLGYCIGQDQYFKRDDVGIIYQLIVVPAKQRGLIGAMLVKTMFDRAAYGCRLFCCWCAQDIEANYFWESLGFIPLAFRAGSRGKRRVHIFWQRRIRSDDTTTPYWFPAQTSSGAIREDRLVLPIPPRTHWRDVMPIVLPGDRLSDEEKQILPGPSRAPRPKPQTPTSIASGGLRFAMPQVGAREKPKKEPRKKFKNDPKLVAAARELRDRWLERVNTCPASIPSRPKYEVGRAIESNETGAMITSVPALRLLSLPLAAA